MTQNEDKRDIIICRCEDLTLADVDQAINDGITDIEELKRFLHVGMGPCQGRTCTRLVARILADKTGKTVTEIKHPTNRPPLVSVPIRELQGNE
jgi:NAD(P)H-nitrite reductase large subunit